MPPARTQNRRNQRPTEHVDLPDTEPGSPPIGSGQVDDTAPILAPPDRVTLESGTVVLLNQLRTRESLALIRIITHGAQTSVMNIRLDPDEPTDAFVTKLVMLLGLAIPDAEDETIGFIRSVVTPVGLVPGRMLSKADRERNAARVEALAEELDNPSLGDLVTIVEAVAVREAPEIQALGKRLASMWRVIRGAGQKLRSLT